MTASIVGSAAAVRPSTGGTATWSLTLPTGITTGDVGYLLVQSTFGPTDSLTAPSGWTLVEGPISSGSANNCVTWTFERAMTSADSGGTVTGTQGQTSARWGAEVVVVHNGTLELSPPSRSQDTADTPTVSIPATTPTAADCLLVMLAGIAYDTGAGSAVAQPSGWTELVDVAAQNTSLANPGVYLATRQLSGQAGVSQVASSTTKAATGRDCVYVLRFAPSAASTQTGTASLSLALSAVATKVASQTGRIDVAFSHLGFVTHEADASLRVVGGFGAVRPNTGGSQNWSVTLPADIGRGMTAFLVVQSTQGSTETLTMTTTGWTVVEGPVVSGSANNCVSWLLKRSLLPSDAGTDVLGSMGNSASRWAVGGLVVTTSAHDSTTKAQDTTDAATVTIPTFTPGHDDVLAIALAGVQYDTGSGSQVNIPAGWGEVVDVAMQQTSGPNAGVWVATTRLLDQDGHVQPSQATSKLQTGRDTVWVVVVSPTTPSYVRFLIGPSHALAPARVVFL